MNTVFEIRDSVPGIVTFRGERGTYIRLPNGDTALTHFGGLCKGTEVMCTIKHLPSERWKTYFVTVDSVSDNGLAA